MQILRRAAYTAAPWKNGGGTTYEALRVPPGGGTFRWRVSIARVDAPGDFSDFSGYDRTLVLLGGAGLLLTCGDGRKFGLYDAGDVAQFDGATAVHCALSAGPCEDLNLIVSQSLPAVQAWVTRLRGPQIVQAPRTGTLLLAAVSEGLKVTAANGESALLGAGDLIVIAPHEAPAPRIEPADTAAAPLVFFALVDDNLGS